MIAYDWQKYRAQTLFILSGFVYKYIKSNFKFQILHFHLMVSRKLPRRNIRKVIELVSLYKALCKGCYVKEYDANFRLSNDFAARCINVPKKTLDSYISLICKDENFDYALEH